MNQPGFRQTRERLTADQRIRRSEAQGSEMQEQRELMRKVELRQRERMALESGPMREFGEHDRCCPACAYELGSSHFSEQSVQRQWVPEKVHCAGRDPNPVAGTEAKCVILGEHLHGRCPACAYSWFERVKFDEAKLPGRGALRYDEVIIDDVLLPLAIPPTMLDVWGYAETPES